MKLPIRLTELLGLVAIATLSCALSLDNAPGRAPAGPVSPGAPVSKAPATPAVASAAQPSSAPAVPDFTAFQDVEKRKRAFYDYLLPKIRTANYEVMQERQWVLDIAAHLVGGQSLTAEQLTRLQAIERRYSVEPRGDVVAQVGALLRRVDVVPASLVLAQAAKESGWGTSRFAVRGNNFFGIWCFTDGCGMRPERRDAGLTHEVAMFDSVADGVRYYIRTLNTQAAYSELRAIRARARQQHQLAPGDELAQGLIRYSARGVVYVKEIQTMIHYNNLHRFTIHHQEA